MKKIGKIRYLKPTKAEAEVIEAERKEIFDLSWLHVVKKVSCGHYTYRGHDIIRYDGRGLTSWRWVWEITDKNGACGHWQTLEMCVEDIDDYFKKGLAK